MKLNFNFSDKRIRAICDDFRKNMLAGHPPDSDSCSNHAFAAQKYLQEKDHLHVEAIASAKLGEAVSATFPLLNQIVIQKNEFRQIRTSESFWLPVILAHEIGHWILHAPVIRRFKRQLDLFSKKDTILDQEYKLESKFEHIAEPDHPAADLLDRQANQFALELLLPEESVQNALKRSGYYPPVIYRTHHLNLMPFDEYNLRLAEKIHPHLQLPIPWIRLRLTELHLLRNQAAAQNLKMSG